MNTQLQKVRQEALMLCAPVFHKMEEISLFNMQKVLEAFRKNHLSAYHFAPSNGYGYGDPGREKLEDVWCDIFHAEASLVRPQFVSGTHALATVLLALLNPGDTMVSAVGSPYDTMQSVIGITGDAPGNLKKRGVRYKEVPLKGNAYDLDAIAAAVDENVKLVEIQRSRGYMLRDSLFPEDIKKIVNLPVKKNQSNSVRILRQVRSLRMPAADLLLPEHISAVRQIWWNFVPMHGRLLGLALRWDLMQPAIGRFSRDFLWHRM